jgi:hypothetical protein
MNGPNYFVIDPGKSSLGSVTFNFAPRHIKHRAHQTQSAKTTHRWHGSGPSHPCPAQQIEQHCFRLITSVLCQQMHSPVHSAKLRVRFASRRLQALPSLASTFT